MGNEKRERKSFCNCKSLKSIAIPKLATSIGYRAFSDCMKLNQITIPSTVEGIGDYAFEGTLYGKEKVSTGEYHRSIGDFQLLEAHF